MCSSTDLLGQLHKGHGTADQLQIAAGLEFLGNGQKVEGYVLV